MRTCLAMLAFACFATLVTSASAQQPAAVRMECRELANSNNALAPNETLVNGMACHPAGVKAEAAAQTKSAASPTPAAYETSPAPATGAPIMPASTRIVPGATVYIEPNAGFENYLMAALQKKKVPLVAVAGPEQATYVLKSTSDEKKAGWAKMLLTKQIHSDNSASVQMIDQRSGAIVFAYSVDKKNTLHGQQTTAEACAKHLKEQIEKK